MNAIFSLLEGAGCSVERDGCDLVVAPPMLSAQQVSLIKKRKAEIVKQLRIRALGKSGAVADVPEANDGSFAPSDVLTLAIRYGIEAGSETADLSNPDERSRQRHQLMRKLGIPREVRCIDCQHSEDAGGNLGHRRRRVFASGACGLWWMTEMRCCVQYRTKEAI